MSNIFTQEYLIKINAHYLVTKQTPKFLTNYIIGIRNNTPILNILKIILHIKETFIFLNTILKYKGLIGLQISKLVPPLFLNNYRKNSTLYLLPEKWINGYLTNFKALRSKFYSQKLIWTHLPATIIFLKPSENITAINETHSIKIPSISLFDKQVNPKFLSYPIPLHADNPHFIKLFLILLKKNLNSNLIKYPTTYKNLR